MTAATKTIVLQNEQIRQKINRIAYEIYENNISAKTLYVVGIEKQGYVLAERICTLLKEISPIDVKLVKLEMHKDEPLEHPIKLSVHVNDLADQSVILVDDVLNSGKTLIYAAHYLLQSPLKNMNTVCLVDRLHRKFPIRADFVGVTLSTTLQEHIQVEFENGNDIVYLE
ncbi:MAG: phosphoribosyltransferase family protein [Bacteroidota bacterium]